MFLDRVSHFGKSLGDQGKCYSSKKLKSLIEVSKVVDLKVQVVSFTMNLIFSPFIHFGKNFGDQAKDRSPKKVKSLIGVPNVVQVKVHVLSFNMILISSP